MTEAISRKERRRLEREARAAAGFQPPSPPKPTLKPVKPITINQSKIFKAFSGGKHLLIHGYAGTGKSFLAIYLALRAIEEGQYKKLIIIRSTVPSRTQGFLPGTEEEKAAVYESPYRSIVDDLYGRSGSYNRMKEAKVIEFMSTSFLRGNTLDNAVILIDEVQNLNDGEANTVMTRPGENVRVVICGDFRQNDLATKKDESCIQPLLKTIGKMGSFHSVEMQIDDIVRSDFVREWIIAREHLNEKTSIHLPSHVLSSISLAG